MITPTDEDMKVAREIARFVHDAPEAVCEEPDCQTCAPVVEHIARALASQREQDAQLLESYLRCNPDPDRYVIKQLAAAIRAGKKE